ncbi:hydrogenase maturation protease [Streptomyces griseochromogenes]|uniref:Hydrogenase n=1 Tax=Streptomyces griseochromogenes TaxID=68214 RepID=A0A1B1B1A9_9ACTN|nr:hydrogenase maturation protease [Streptomyces griseochromogenes]ANP52616.1 hydrogenase [Streptomyces griseochromogenes]MBP2047197.1 hydrogenase maturation protease [Streptomyces griseochromogenes]
MSPVPGRLLVAGVGNIFLGDDAFGPEVIRALDRRPLPPEVRVRDFGIRGLDLAYTLLDGCATAVLVDAAPRGHRPGTLTLIEAEPPDGTVVPEAHGMDPEKVLALAAHLGDEPLPRVLVLACEPGVLPRGDEDILPGLGAPVRAAVDRAVEALHTLIPVLLADPAAPAPPLGRPMESGPPHAAALPGLVADRAEDR